jgi:hypothetical protein
VSGEHEFGVPEDEGSELRDEALSAEIELLGEVIAAVSSAPVPLDDDQIDSILGVRADNLSSREDADLPARPGCS